MRSALGGASPSAREGRGMDEHDELREQVGDIVERHGDEVADELLKTVRTARRVSIGMLVVIGVVFVAVLILMAVMVSRF
jgi:hypothetical protein